MVTVKDLTNDFFQGFLSADGLTPENPVVQVMEARLLKNGGADKRHRFRLSDGVFSFATCLDQSSNSDKVDADQLSQGHPVLRLVRYKRQTIKSEKAPEGKVSLVIIDYEIVAKEMPILGNPVPHSCNERDYRGMNPTNVLNNAQPQQQVRRNPPTPNRGSSLVSQNLTPIRLITPYVNKWRICGLVTAKEDMRDIKTARGELRVFNFEITDEEGGCIRIAAFAETADKFYAIIQKGSMYYISGGTVKQANKRFNTTGHDYELTMRTDSEISPCMDREKIDEPRMNLSVVPLALVAARANQCIDVIAIVEVVSELQQVTQRSTGSLLDKRDLQLIDESGTLVNLTLWADQARNKDTDLLHQAICVKGVSVREYNGSYSLSAMSSTRMEVNPDCEEVRALYAWYHDKRPHIEAKSISSNTGSSYGRDLRVIGLASLLSLGRDEAKGRYFNITGIVESLRAEGALYKSCGSNGCKKKVIEVDNQFRCEKCNLTLDTYKYVLLLSIEISDFTGSHWVTLFEENASKLLKSTAEELGKLLEAGKLDEYNEIFNAVRFQEYTFRIRAKSEFYNDTEKIKWNVYDCNEVDYDKYSEQLNKAIPKIEAL